MDNKEVTVIEGEQTTEKRTPFDLSLAAIASTNLIELAEQAEKRLAAFEKIWKGSLQRTNPNDWSDQGGKPYLEASGGHKIARWLGVSWRPVSGPDQEDLGHGHYLIRYTGEFTLSGAIITETGSRASNEPFFNKSKGRELPASEVDKGDVMKAAYTNLIQRGITALLGMRNLTWEDLKQYAGINRKDVKGVSYGKTPPLGSQSAEPGKPAAKPAEGPAENGAMATEAQVKAIHAILTAMKVSDELGKMQKVAGILGLKEIPTSLAKLTKSQASTVIGALQKEVGGEQ